MKQNRFYQVAMSAALVLLATVGFTACSEKDNVVESAFMVDNEIVANGINTDVRGGYYYVTVTGNGAWTATLSEDEDWLYVSESTGQGNGKVEVFIEANYTGFDRNTTLTITCNDNVVPITITQSAGIDGPMGYSTNYFYAIMKKGLGKGYNITRENDDITKNFMSTLVNTNPLKNIAETADDDLYTEQERNKTDMEVHIKDSLQQKKDTLGIKAYMSIDYNRIKFNIGAKFSMHENLNVTDRNSEIHASFPLWQGDLNINAICSYQYNSGNFKSYNARTHLPEYNTNYLNSGFLNARDTLVSYCSINNISEYNSSDAKLKLLCSNIVQRYGHGVIVGSTLGGSIDIVYNYSSVECEEALQVDSAHVSFAIDQTIPGQGLKISINAEATYQKKSWDYFRTMDLDYTIYGGDTKDHIAIQNILADSTKTKDDLDKELTNWLNSLYISTYDEDKDNQTTNAEVISLSISPIWSCIDDDNAANVLKGYIYETVSKDDDKCGFLEAWSEE